MPRGDGTGPRGMGRMTGRRNGNCVDNGESRTPSNSFGNQRGRFVKREMRQESGRIQENSQIEETSEKEILKNEMQNLKQQIESVGKRLTELVKK